MLEKILGKAGITLQTTSGSRGIRAGTEDREMVIQPNPSELFHGSGSVRFAFTQIESDAATVDAQRLQKLQNPVDFVLFVRRNADVVQEVALVRMLRLRETDPIPCAGNPSGEDTLKAAVQIEGNFRLNTCKPAAKVSHTFPRAVPISRGDENSVQRPMSFENRNAPIVDKPGNFGERITQTQRDQQRKPSKDFAFRSEPDQHNFLGLLRQTIDRASKKHLSLWK